MSKTKLEHRVEFLYHSKLGKIGQAQSKLDKKSGKAQACSESTDSILEARAWPGLKYFGLVLPIVGALYCT